jgi:hypothetical protein
MSSRIILFFALLLTGRWASGQRLEAVVSGGFQSLNLHWSIAGNSAGQAPNIYSELRWRRVGGAAVDAALRYGLGRRWIFFGEGSRVLTSTGSVSDRDYAGDNRTAILYNETFAGSNGYRYAVAAGTGYRLWFGKRFELVPAAGYGVSGQHLTITDPGGVYDFLNSYYQASWFGPLVRVAGNWRPGGRWEVTGVVSYHQVNYRAKADWNLIADFSHPVSFRHRADGFGAEGELGVVYRVCGRMELLFAMNGFAWGTGTGIDELYRSSGTSQQTQLNEVVMDGLGFRLGMRWKW